MADVTKTCLTAAEEQEIKAVDETCKTGDYVRVLGSRQVWQKEFDFAALKNFEIFEDDVFIITPLKSGTTWTQEIVWLMLNDVDVDKAKDVMQFYRAPFLEREFLGGSGEKRQPYPEGQPQNPENITLFHRHSMEFTRRMPRPRLIKTHMPLKFLPDRLLDTCKVIFVNRNVKDVAVSAFYHYGSFKPEVKSKGFKKFAKLFKDGLFPYSPGVDMALEAWEHRDHRNMLYLTYEELRADLDGALNRLMPFLGVTLSPENLQVLKQETSMESLRKKTSVNKVLDLKLDPSKGFSFIRKGIVGDWKNHFDQEMNDEWDKWIQEKLHGTGYKMTFDLEP